MPAQLILTVTPDGHILVSLRADDGTLTPPRAIAVDQDLAAPCFRGHHAGDRSAEARDDRIPTIGRARDGEPAIADVIDGEQGR